MLVVMGVCVCVCVCVCAAVEEVFTSFTEVNVAIQKREITTTWIQLLIVFEKEIIAHSCI